MIDITHARTYGWEAAIRGMRNPMNSWDKSDSSVNNIGENDITLMKKLAKAGTDHRKYLRMITVTCDILAPLYWWKEFDTYKVGTVANSCSTMHKIHDKEFEELDFSFENLSSELNALDLGQTIIKTLNQLRDAYILTKDKCYWYQMIQLLPSSYNQKRTVMINYEVLANVYKARKNHKLDEWKDFCYLVEALPYSELFTQLDNDHD